MKMRFLGKSGLRVSEFCLGTANFGATGGFEKTGYIGQKEADYMVGMCLDNGVNFFNTAEMYSEGNSEEVLGRALGPRRKEAIVITKINPGPFGGGLSRKHIIEGCEMSLKKLGTDYIDLYQLHMFDPFTPLEVTIGALDDLVRQGKVRYIGCSNFNGWQLMKSLAISNERGWEKFITIEAMYSLASRELEFEVIPACLDQEVAILAYSPLHGGFLSGKYSRKLPFPKGTRFDNMSDTQPWPVDPEQLFDIVEELNKIAMENDTTVSQTALNYVLRKPGVCSIIIGMRNKQQLEENLKAAEWELTAEEVARLDEISEPVRKYPYFIFNPLKAGKPV